MTIDWDKIRTEATRFGMDWAEETSEQGEAQPFWEAFLRVFGIERRKYAEFEAGGGAITLSLLGRRALAKDAGVPEEGSGSHRLAINGGDFFTDPDGFEWEPTSVASPGREAVAH